MLREQYQIMNKQEQYIIGQAFSLLQEELGEYIKWGRHNLRRLDSGNDATFTVYGKKIYVAAKNEVRPGHIPWFVSRKNQINEILVVANYITPNAKKLLRENGINYVDYAGNIWFKMEPVYIHIEGLRNAMANVKRKNRAFTRTGTIVIFSLLNNPELINETYREISRVTEVALGTVHKVFDGLKEDGFLLKKTESEWMINDYSKLLDRWQSEYVRKLKPGLFLKRFRPIDADFYINWKNLPLKWGAQWGGEPAGDLLTNYLKPEIFTLYTKQPQREIMKDYMWVPDPEGNIYVYKQFWQVDLNKQPKNCVPPIIAYADLMDTGESRCIETAMKINEQYIQKH